MKIYFILSVLLIFVIAFTSCSNSDQKVEREIILTNDVDIIPVNDDTIYIPTTEEIFNENALADSIEDW